MSQWQKFEGDNCIAYKNLSHYYIHNGTCINCEVSNCQHWSNDTCYKCKEEYINEKRICFTEWSPLFGNKIINVFYAEMELN